VRANGGARHRFRSSTRSSTRPPRGSGRPVPAPLRRTRPLQERGGIARLGALELRNLFEGGSARLLRRSSTSPSASSDSKAVPTASRRARGSLSDSTTTRARTRPAGAEIRFRLETSPFGRAVTRSPQAAALSAWRLRFGPRRRGGAQPGASRCSSLRTGSRGVGSSLGSLASACAVSQHPVATGIQAEPAPPKPVPPARVGMPSALFGRLVISWESPGLPRPTPSPGRSSAGMAARPPSPGSSSAERTGARPSPVLLVCSSRSRSPSPAWAAMAPCSGRVGLPICTCGQIAPTGKREPPTACERAGTEVRIAKEGGSRCRRSGRRRIRRQARRARRPRRGSRSRRRRPRAGSSRGWGRPSAEPSVGCSLFGLEPGRWARQRRAKMDVGWCTNWPGARKTPDYRARPCGCRKLESARVAGTYPPTRRSRRRR
jgi:hypothetical protein